VQTLAGPSKEFTARKIVLKDGWVGVETDTGNQKNGDGLTAWGTLAYIPPTEPPKEIVSNPPKGYKRITNLYVDEKGELVIETDEKLPVEDVKE
jgi:hypothetical protein